MINPISTDANINFGAPPVLSNEQIQELLNEFGGTQRVDELETVLRQMPGVNSVRVVYPWTAITMDMRNDRVNISMSGTFDNVDPDNSVITDIEIF